MISVVITLPNFFLFAPTQNFKSLEKSAGSRDPLALKTFKEPTELPSHLSTLRPVQDPRTTNLQSRRTNSRPHAPKGTGWISTRKVYRRTGHFAYANIENSFEAKKKAGAMFRSDSCL